ncbi:MAG: LpqB family beta-propeller domain-containing protein [Dermatophilaceae bacterium]
MNVHRRLGTILVAAVAVLGLSACGGLPDHSPVIEGRRLGDPVIDSIRVIPQGPADGASQAQVALGFIRAGEDYDETHETGRAYLAPSSDELWRWSAEPITIYDTSDRLVVKSLTPESLEVTTVAVAEVSPDGRYRELPAETPATVTFGMTKVSGEWRIELPSTGFGLWLDSNAFDRLYVPRQLNYVTPSGRRLVPDVRWFPSGSKLATTLARAQLGPVPDYLAGALTTGAPPGTKLAVNAVPVDAGKATVNLNAAALAADPQERTALWAQLVATLSQVPGVSSVALSVEGTNLELPNGGTSASSAAELHFESVDYPNHETALLRSSDERITRIDPRYIPDDTLNKLRTDPTRRGDDPISIPKGWQSLALSVDGKEVAAIGGDLQELSRWRGSEFVTVPDFATEMSRPAYDNSGYLWVAGTDARGNSRIWVLGTSTMDSAPPPQPLGTPWLAGRKVVALTVAPDGARLLVVTSKPDGSDAQLGLAGIIRGPNGAPQSVLTPWRQADALTLIRDVTWLEADTFAVLGRIDPKEPVRPWVGRIGAGLDGVRRHGGESPEDARLDAVPEARFITSVGGPRGVLIITEDHRVLARAGSAWREVAQGTDLLIPGH